MRYIVRDSLGNLMGRFDSYPAADSFKFTHGNPGWEIEEVLELICISMFLRFTPSVCENRGRFGSV